MVGASAAARRDDALMAWEAGMLNYSVSWRIGELDLL
jgi:hypothetical protein